MRPDGISEDRITVFSHVSCSTQVQPLQLYLIGLADVIKGSPSDHVFATRSL